MKRRNNLICQQYWNLLIDIDIKRRCYFDEKLWDWELKQLQKKSVNLMSDLWWDRQRWQSPAEAQGCWRAPQRGWNDRTASAGGHNEITLTTLTCCYLTEFIKQRDSSSFSSAESKKTRWISSTGTKWWHFYTKINISAVGLETWQDPV